MRITPTELVESKRDVRGRRITPAAVRAYEQIGLTQRAFARREGIKYSTLVPWVQLRRKETAAVRPTFAEFTLPGPSGLAVRWPDGVVIRGASVEDVAKLLRLLRF